MSRATLPTYKTRNWPAYSEALKRRGSLTIWFDPAMTWEAAPTGKRGRQTRCSPLGPRLSDCYVSRLLRLAWLAPDVLERLVVCREPCAISLHDLCFVASLPWDEQSAREFD